VDFSEPTASGARVVQKECEERTRFAATCGAERNAMERSVTKVGYLPAGGL